jgi:bacterioferritin-associated ferredoxin
MYVCICNAVTDQDIADAALRGARSVKDLKRELGVAGGCGSCACLAREVLEEARGQGPGAGFAGALPAGAFMQPED